MGLVTFVVFSSVPEVISRPEPGRGLVPQLLGYPKISHILCQSGCIQVL